MAVAPERVLVNAACVVIGVATLFGQPAGRLHGVWDDGFIITWGIVMMVGGTTALIGYWNYPYRRWSRPVERLGYLGILIAATVYGVGLIIEFGWPGLTGAVLFFGIAASKAIRLVVTSAYRSYLIESGDHQEGF
jgi:hypothetical protein